MSLRLLTVGSLPPEWGGPRRGGVATFHAAILSELLARAADVELVGAVPPAGLDREIPVRTFVRPVSLNRADFYADVLERASPDVVLMNHIANTVGVAHGSLVGAPPAVGVVHSWHNVTFATGERRRRALGITAEALQGMSAMVAPSRAALAEGRDLGFEYPANTEAIHYPIPPAYMSNGLDVQAPGREGVLFVGSLIERKAPEALIEAVARLPQTHALLIGEGELEPDLRALAERLSVDDRVKVVGGLPGPDHLQRVRGHMLGARALCLPSRSESFGIVFIEALACGTPVVGFGPTVREIREAMGVDIGEPLEIGTPEEIAAALERVCAAEWDREGLRAAALAAFGLDRIAARYLDLLRGVAAQGTVG